jgi:lipopolysaccharide transport system ATP-binding protein
MSETVIQVENISKLFRLGTIGTGSFRQDVKRFWQSRILKKEDPFFQGINSVNGHNSFLWALKNISFEVKEGDVYGIIGQNGAGKSTLLKILSRIIRPTEGVVRGKGKVSSLLEVGTGFHYELTGRENIFISGHILGMTKNDIHKNFDEIVDFAGIGHFLDTPIKRYSSGMYVRLAFAVAAHLEPDILVVDEVLAVGDAEFQKKCLNKMKDVSTQKGRTILFVSHNMQAVNLLCNKALWLQKGNMVANGETNTVVSRYLSTFQKRQWKQQWSSLEEAPGNDHIRVLSVELVPILADPLAPIDIRTPLTIRFRFYNAGHQINLVTGLVLFTLSGECIFDVCCKPAIYKEGIIEGECQIPGNFLNNGSYYFSISFVKDTTHRLFYFEECLAFDVEDYRENTNWYGRWLGYVRPQFPFTLQPQKEVSSRVETIE